LATRFVPRMDRPEGDRRTGWHWLSFSSVGGRRVSTWSGVRRRRTGP
jgi:hypothetical protein